MKRVYLLVLVLMVGIITANDNSATPAGFVPGTVESYDSGTHFEQSTAVDYSMEGNVRHDVQPVLTGKDTYEFTVVNWSDFNWFGPYCRGLDVVTYSVECLMSPAISSDSAYFINFDDGLMLDKMPLDATNTGAWGCYPYSSVNFNDFSSSNMFYSANLGVSWTTTTNPAGSDGRGMDVDYNTNLIWETSSSTGIYSFAQQASTGTYYDVSAHIPGQMSGLTVYDGGGYHILIVNTYSTGYAYFFDLDDSLNFLGAVPYPYEAFTLNSYGLAYCASRDTFFWAYQDSVNTNRYLVEMTLTITTSLEQTTWGEIKSTF